MLTAPLAQVTELKLMHFPLDKFLFQNVRYRVTLEDCYDTERKGAHNNEGQDGPALDSKVSCRKNLKVKDEDRHLDKADGYNVEDFAKVN